MKQWPSVTESLLTSLLTFSLINIPSYVEKDYAKSEIISKVERDYILYVVVYAIFILCV